MVRMSVIIATRDRPGDLARCLAALAECVPELHRAGAAATLAEVLVVDDASTARLTPSVANATTLPVTLLRHRLPQGAAASRTEAAHAATGEVLAFLDDDALPRGDWLVAIAESVPALAPAVTGRVLRFDTDLLSRARQARYDQRYRGVPASGEVSFFAGGNSAIDAATFRAVGGFRSHSVGGDNQVAAVLAARGTPVRFVPGLVVVHRNSKGWRRACRDAIGAGRGHLDRITVRQAARALRAAAVGETGPVRNVNLLLGTLHLLARLAPGPGRGGDPGPPTPGSGCRATDPGLTRRREEV